VATSDILAVRSICSDTFSIGLLLSFFPGRFGWLILGHRVMELMVIGGLFPSQWNWKTCLLLSKHSSKAAMVDSLGFGDRICRVASLPSGLAVHSVLGGGRAGCLKLLEWVGVREKNVGIESGPSILIAINFLSGLCSDGHDQHAKDSGESMP